MATILRTYKYINFFTGHYLKACHNNYFPLQYVLKTHYGALNANRNYSTLIITEFSNKLNIQHSTSVILQNLKDKYFEAQNVSRGELINLLATITDTGYNNLSSITKLKLEKDIHVLIGCCGKVMRSEMPNTRAHFVNHLWLLIKTLDLKLNQSHYNALLRVYLENEQDFSPAEILLEMSNNGIEPDGHTYEYLLTYYCRKGNIEEANKILNYLKENKIAINENIFNALIIGNAEANDMNSALNILNIMREMNCPPSSKTYAALLEAYARKGDIDNIMKIIEKAKIKNIIIKDSCKMDIVYYLAINGYGEYIDKVLSTFTWDYTFTNENRNLISKLMNHKQIDAVIKILLTVKKSELSEQIINATSYPMAKNIIELDLPQEKVIEILTQFEKEGFYMFETALHQAFVNQDIKYCIPLLRAWSETGFKIEEFYFYPIFIMNGMKNSNDVLEILRTMKKEFGIRPSFETLTRFVLPYIYKYKDGILKFLTNDIKISNDQAVNAILYNYINKNRIEDAVKFFKDTKHYNVDYDKEKLLPVLKNALSRTENVQSCNFLKTQLEQVISYNGGSNKLENNLPPVLKIIDLGYQLKHFSRNEDLVGAEKCITIIKRLYGYRLSANKLFCYIDLLVKNDRIKDALDTLKYFSSKGLTSIWFNQNSMKQCLASLNLLADKGSVEGVNQLFNFLKSRNMNIVMKVTEPLIRVHLVRNEPKEALEVVKQIHREYDYIPGRLQIMKSLIEAEEVDSLQCITDFSIQHQGETLTLISLAVAFLKCDRLRQCRRILESASSKIKLNTIRSFVNVMLIENNISEVKNFLEVTKGLDVIDRNILYDMLIEKYSITNNWSEAMALWKQMEEESIIPSEMFLANFIELLTRNGQTKPNSVTYPIAKIEVNEDFYLKLTKIYLRNNAHPCQEFLKVLVENIVNSGDIEMVELIEKNWSDLYGQFLKLMPIRFEACVKANKVDSYLQYVKTKLQNSSKEDFVKDIKNINHTWLKYLLEHPENVKEFESLAEQISLKKNYFKPMLLVLSYYFLKDPQRAKEKWTAISTKILENSVTYNILIKSYVEVGCFDQLPQLAEIFNECSNFNKKMFFDEFLSIYDEHNKYEEGFRVLAKWNTPKESKEINNQEPIQLRIAF